MITITELLLSTAAAIYILQFISNQVRAYRSERSYRQLRDAAIEEATEKIKRQYPFIQGPSWFDRMRKDAFDAIMSTWEEDMVKHRHFSDHSLEAALIRMCSQPRSHLDRGCPHDWFIYPSGLVEHATDCRECGKVKNKPKEDDSR